MENRFHAKQVMLLGPNQIRIIYTDSFHIDLSPSELRRFHEEQMMAKEINDIFKGKEGEPENLGG